MMQDRSTENSSSEFKQHFKKKSICVAHLTDKTPRVINAPRASGK